MEEITSWNGSYRKLDGKDEEVTVTESKTPFRRPIPPRLVKRRAQKNDVSKSFVGVISDYIFIIIGICFCVEWAEVIVQAVLLLFVLFSSLKLLQMYSK